MKDETVTASVGATSLHIADGRLTADSGMGATLSLEDEARLDATKILLNSPDVGSSEPKPKPLELTEIILKDGSGNPLGNQPFIARLPDGTEYAGVVNEEGKASVALPHDAEIRFINFHNFLRS